MCFGDWQDWEESSGHISRPMADKQCCEATGPCQGRVLLRRRGWRGPLRFLSDFTESLGARRCAIGGAQKAFTIVSICTAAECQKCGTTEYPAAESEWNFSIWMEKCEFYVLYLLHSLLLSHQRTSKWVSKLAYSHFFSSANILSVLRWA